MSARPALQRENVVMHAGRRRTAGELADLGASFLTTLGTAAPVAITAGDGMGLLQAACGLASLGRDGLVLPRERLTPNVRDRLEQDGFSSADLDTRALLGSGAAPAVEGRVHLLTSGSTGEPKRVEHTWASLFTMARVKTVRASRWLLTYQPGTYAWYQVVTAWMFLPSQSLIVPSAMEPAVMIAEAAHGGASAISATPTFWRLAMLHAEPGDLRALAATLETISLGGEPVDQPILDHLHTLYPAARLVHIYASTEAGASIVVADRHAGFPAAWLDDPAHVPGLRIEGGTLRIHSPHAAAGYRGWIDTADIAELRGDRVMLLGRQGHAMVNIGGAKVLTADVERVLLSHPRVLWCRVHGVRAPLVGQLLAARVVVRTEDDETPLTEAALTAHCAAGLPEYMVPRMWELTDRIPTSDNWKTEV